MDSVYFVEQIIGPKGIIHLEHPDRWNYTVLEMFNINFFVTSAIRSFGAFLPYTTWRKSALSPGVIRIRLVTFARVERWDGKDYVEEFDRRLAFKRF